MFWRTFWIVGEHNPLLPSQSTAQIQHNKCIWNVYDVKVKQIQKKFYPIYQNTLAKVHCELYGKRLWWRKKHTIYKFVKHIQAKAENRTEKKIKHTSASPITFECILLGNNEKQIIKNKKKNNTKIKILFIGGEYCLSPCVLVLFSLFNLIFLFVFFRFLSKKLF